MSIRIREFIFSQDYDSVHSIWVDAAPGVHVGRSDTPEEVQKKISQDPDLFLVAEDGGILVGTVMGGFDGRRGLIYHLAVTPGAQGKGIGIDLMVEVENRLRAKGCLRCYLMVTKENTHAIEFYQKQGWENLDDLLIFGKDI